MTTIEKGQFFLDHKALKQGKTKAKYFIVLNDGENDDDELVCIVLNTEHRMDLYKVGCNKEKQKFVLYKEHHKFDFLKEPSSLILDDPRIYQVKEFYFDNILILDDIADENLCRQINNCINYNHLLPKIARLLKDCYKRKLD
ncbi:MAG TPA: hypothetical protein ENN33_16475 [Ignavibacteria bacterium]|nr:hypothetical protein [Ignavibacteria bacterium]